MPYIIQSKVASYRGSRKKLWMCKSEYAKGGVILTPPQDRVKRLVSTMAIGRLAI